MSLSAAFARLQPRRQVHGISATLLPYTASGEIDWPAFRRHLWRTHDAGLAVAVNMDTGFGDLLTDPERAAVLDTTRAVLGAATEFYAGAFAADGDVRTYHASIAAIEKRGAIPVIVQSKVMQALGASDKAARYRDICDGAQRAVAFELGPMFAPHGEIWDDETFRRILEIPKLIGAKHSSLQREIELRRLQLRDRQRPEFRVYTGNDLAIDMVAYGSDYLLGLSTFAPAAFARRDAALRDGNSAFLQLNDALQHLGNVGFRHPVPAYKHAAAMFLHLVGDLDSDAIHPRAARRPPSERILLLDCALRLGMVEDYEAVYRLRVAPFLNQ